MPCIVSPHPLDNPQQTAEAKWGGNSLTNMKSLYELFQELNSSLDSRATHEARQREKHRKLVRAKRKKP